MPDIHTASSNGAAAEEKPAQRNAIPPPPSPAKTGKKRRGPVFWVVTIVLVGAALAWTVHFALHAYYYEETDDAYISGHIHQISPQAGGSVTEVLVDENQFIRQGQILVRIDPLEYEIALHRAQANLAQAQAQKGQAHAAISQARAQAAQLRAQVAQAEAELSRAAAQLQIASQNLGRDTRLYSADTRAIARADVDQTKSTFEGTQASLNAMKANLEGSRSNVAAAEAQVESAEAQFTAAQAAVAASEAAVHDAERELSYTTVKAPVAGRIGNKNVEMGNRVQVGQALFALVEPDLWVLANFKETELANMKPNQRVEMTIDAVPGHQFLGKVYSISPATGAQFALLPPDNATGNFTKVVQRVPVKIVFDPESMHGFEDRLRAGLSVVVNVRVR